MNLKEFVDNQFISKAGKLGDEYETKYGGCSQAVAGALMRTFNFGNKGLLRASNALAGGVCRHGQMCGALLGGLMMISYLVGRDDLENLAQHETVMAYGNVLMEMFENEFGTIICREIQEKRFGRSYNLLDPNELQKFLDDGGHGPEGAPYVTRIGAELAAKVIIRIVSENPAALGFSLDH